MDGVEIFSKALVLATTVVKQVRRDHFSNVTPDTEWNVRDLVGHMLYELSWVPDLIEGKSVEEIGNAYEGDLIGDSDIDLAVHWQAAADKAEAAITEVDPDEIAHVSYGEISNDEYLKQAGTDQLLHTWDLGKSIGVVVKFDLHLAQTIYDNALPHRAMLQQSGLFADPLTVSSEADIQTKLLGFFGRDANWQAP